MAIHSPVLLKEVIESLNPQPGQKFIDATADGGGHALRIIEKLMPGGKFLGIEWDNKLYQHLKFLISNSQFSNEVTLVNDSYVNLKNIAETHGFTNADGILFDLGMSSWHLEEAGR
ncbi:MAG: 16S rRNA (cytosine(1402)-N(4))-methyltransferase, partial [Patescibacteria group bacterium]